MRTRDRQGRPACAGGTPRQGDRGTRLRPWRASALTRPRAPAPVAAPARQPGDDFEESMEIVNFRNLSGDRSAAALLARGLVRVDRRTRWGNPYRISPQASRDDVIAQYRRHLWEQIRRGDVSLEDLAALAESKGLVCW